MYEGTSELPTTPGAIIGYRRDGRPIRLQAGGDPTHDPEGGNDPEPRTYTQEELDRFLTRERDKLHGRISKTDDRFQAMDAEVKELRAAQKKREAEEEKHRKEAEAAAKRAAEAELSAKELVDQRAAEWKAEREALETQFSSQFTNLQQQLAERDAVLEKEREFSKLQAYAQAKVAALSDQIAPELLDYIGGNTPEEIDASVELAKVKTAQILQNIQQAQVSQRAAMPGVSPSGFTPTGPIDMQGTQQTLTPEQIRDMPMDEFSKVRATLGIGKKGVGLFG